MSTLLFLIRQDNELFSGRILIWIWYFHVFSLLNFSFSVLLCRKREKFYKIFLCFLLGSSWDMGLSLNYFQEKFDKCNDSMCQLTVRVKAVNIYIYTRIFKTSQLVACSTVNQKSLCKINVKSKKHYFKIWISLKDQCWLSKLSRVAKPCVWLHRLNTKL